MQEWFKLAVLALKISVFVQVLAIGLGASWEDVTYLFRRPFLLVNSILARNVIAPVVAILLIKAFSFHVAIAITLGVRPLRVRLGAAGFPIVAGDRVGAGHG
jgi:BASS family bile acid:Na+ symporter